MRIAICAQRFVPPLIGGVDVYADRVGRALTRQGHEVSIVAFDPWADTREPRLEPGQVEHGGMRVRRIRFALDQRPNEVFARAYDDHLGLAIETVLKRLDIELFVIMNFYYPTLASVEAARRLGVRVVHIATDFVPVCRRSTFIRWDGRPCRVGESVQSCSACFVSHRQLGKVASSVLGRLPAKTLVGWARKARPDGKFRVLAILQPYWKQVTLTEERLRLIGPLRKEIDLVLAPTRYTLEVFLANGFGPDQVRLLPFGVEDDTPLARTEHVPADHTRFLFIGRLQPYKGAHILVEAFGRLRRPKGATLTVLGTADGHEDYYENLKALMARNSQIDFGGRIQPADLPRAFAHADYFVLPSLWHENSPLVLLDALQSGTPVLASRVGGVTDLVQDGENGLLFPMGDRRSLQSLLQRAIDSPSLGRDLASGAGTGLVKIDDYVRTMIELSDAQANHSSDPKSTIDLTPVLGGQGR